MSPISRSAINQHLSNTTLEMSSLFRKLEQKVQMMKQSKPKKKMMKRNEPFTKIVSRDKREKVMGSKIPSPSTGMYQPKYSLIEKLS